MIECDGFDNFYPTFGLTREVIQFEFDFKSKRPAAIRPFDSHHG